MSEDLSWKDNLPEDVRSAPSLENINDVGALAKGYVESQRMIGGRIPIPKDDNPESWNEVYAKLGRPESADKYEFQRPEDVKWDESREKAFLERAHAMGLNNKQVQELISWDGELAKNSMNAFKESSVAALKEEWGDGYDKNIAAAQRAINSLGDDELKSFLDETGMGNHPVMIKFANKIGQLMSEDKAEGDGGNSLSMDPSTAKQKIAAILSDPNDLYHASHQGKPGHQERIYQVQALFELAYPG